ncbi:MAG: proteasome accessory factor PafA2 family protein, partial [Myxococcota bacterium]
MSARKPPNNGRRQREQPLDGRPSRRLMGLETEYAIRYGGAPRPRHDHIYDDLIAVLRDETEVYDGDRRIANRQVFVGNGGAFYYEFQPTHRADGLVEGSTPECRGPLQLLAYQRAQEELLKRALRKVHPRLAHRGHYGPVGLLKNARDVEGHGYGTHENYE